jgi:hypothetical protein
LITSIKESAEIETGMAEKSSWDQANRRQNLGLVWRKRQKISQIMKDYFCLPFFLLIILWKKGMSEEPNHIMERKLVIMIYQFIFLLIKFILSLN